MPEPVVVDASAIVDLLAATDRAPAVHDRLRTATWHAPAHLDAEVLSALGRLARAGHVAETEIDARLALLAELPLQRHLLPPLLGGAWALRASIRLVDALYVDLAEQLDAPLVTTDARLGRVTPRAEVVAPS